VAVSRQRGIASRMEPDQAKDSALRKDVGKQEDGFKTADYILETYGRIDLLVNGAGMAYRGVSNVGWRYINAARHREGARGSRNDRS
jgi:NAD(P)-dependent dehydrogenase (short-subunit alcohol dehydrogenase family)